MSEDYTSTGVAEPPAESESARKESVREARRASRNGDDPSKDAETKPKGPPKSIWREYFESAVVTVIMALFGMTFIVQAVKVPTGSMQNTIIIGDHLLVNKFIFAPGPPLPFLPMRDIRRGDIIVFKYPGNPDDPIGDRREDNQPFKTNYVKRVIGLPGDRIEVRDEMVYVNGQQLPEHRIAAIDHDDNQRTEDQDESKKQLDIRENPPRQPGETYNVYYSNKPLGGDDIFDVPQGHYFVMGDNRNNSADSRVWGFVPRELVVGRAMFVYWSYDESAPVGSGLFDKISAFFTNTRWSRTGTMIK